VSTTDEQRIPGALPLWEVPGWRDRFGVTAGITGRGDDPAEPFDLGLWGSAPVGTIMTRWRRFLGAFPAFPAAVLAHQVHGNQVLWHAGDVPGWTLIPGADGHATNTAGRLLLVTVADCVPVYLVAPRRRAIAILHAGWRGTAAEILARGVALLHDRAGVAPAELVGHAGVAISGPCYEVGAEVMTGVGQQAAGPGPWHLDLREVLKSQAQAIGIGEFTVSTRCTARDSGDFFSHRASGGADGRMVAYLGLDGGQRRMDDG
jgi:YfiH family protein